MKVVAVQLCLPCKIMILSGSAESRTASVPALDIPLPIPPARTMSTKSNDVSFETVLTEPHYLLLGIPPEPNLPFMENSQDSHYACFLNFSLESDLMEKIKDGVGVFSEQFKSVFGWQTRLTGDGIILIVEHGLAICAVVDVLQKYHDQYPSNEVIMKWGRDVLRGVRQIYTKKGLDYPLVQDQ